MSVQSLQASSAGAETERWHDTKRYAWLLGAIIPMLPFAAGGLVSATGLDLFWYFGPLFVYGVIPLIDLALGTDPNNPPDEVIERLEEDRYYRWVTYAFIPMQYVALHLDRVARCSQPAVRRASDKIGLALTIGMVAGIGINTAHELGHKKEKHERWFARVCLAQTAYGHFYIEHNRGHHVRVATPEDPASSRLGETVWEFLPRTVRGSLSSAWGLEKKRFARRQQSSPGRSGTTCSTPGRSRVVLWGALMIAFGWSGSSPTWCSRRSSASACSRRSTTSSTTA